MPRRVTSLALEERTQKQLAAIMEEEKTTIVLAVNAAIDFYYQERTIAGLIDKIHMFLGRARTGIPSERVNPTDYLRIGDYMRAAECMRVIAQDLDNSRLPKLAEEALDWAVAIEKFYA